MQKNILFIAVLLVSFAGLSLTHDIDPNAETNLITLTEENFNNFVDLNGTDTWFIMFYAPWCGHCKRALPAWNEFSVRSKGKWNVATINCDDNKSLRDRFGVQGFPTFLMLKDKKMIPYKGPRTIEEWTKFVESGYLTAQADEIPSGPSILKNIEKTIEGVVNEMHRLYKNDFTLFITIISVLLFTCFLTCWCATKLGGDDEPVEDETVAPEGKKVAPSEATTEDDKVKKE